MGDHQKILLNHKINKGLPAKKREQMNKEENKVKKDRYTLFWIKQSRKVMGVRGLGRGERNFFPFLELEFIENNSLTKHSPLRRMHSVKSSFEQSSVKLFLFVVSVKDLSDAGIVHGVHRSR